jgi:hypothetical protein
MTKQNLFFYIVIMLLAGWGLADIIITLLAGGIK